MRLHESGLPEILTQNGKGKANENHNHVKQIPDICCVEYGTCINPLAQLVVEEGRDPDEQSNFSPSDAGLIPHNENRIIQA